MPKIYTRNTWTDEVLASSAKYNISGSAVNYSNMDIQLATAMTVTGTPLTAVYMNNIENGINALDNTLISGTFSAKAGAYPAFDGKYQATGTTIPNTGWIGVMDSWTYASSGTITIPSDGTSIYQKGYGIRFKQGGGYKYMYLTAVASTLLTVTGGSDYTVANSAITNVAYTTNPGGAFGFPGYFNCTPAFTAGLTVGNGTLTGRFKMMGNRINYKGRLVFGSTTSISGNVNIDVPISIEAVYEVSANLGLCTCVDTGTTVFYGCSLYSGVSTVNLRPFNVGGTYLSTSLLSSTIPHTWAATDELGWDVNYYA